MTDFSNALGDISFEGGRAEPDTQYRKMREDERLACCLSAHAVQDGVQVPCIVVDISSSGAQLCYDPQSNLCTQDKPLLIDTPEIGRLPVALQWCEGTRIGVRFTNTALNPALLHRKLSDGP
ncbi:PilZ domain-containing protein [Primorskyibacter sp. 2E107]|uniref:PilZ domain-containing protein n=1 Tax=Primorskyibacter sp. 2E107 TaxID=3403458 RepID=UPI003AF50246